MTTPVQTDQLRALQKIIDPSLLITDSTEAKAYAQDWTRFVPPSPLAVALPRNTKDVSLLLKHCRELKISVVPSGGRTGLAGGAVAGQGELVVNLSRMNQLQPVDATTRTIRAEAGVVNEALQEHCAPYGLFWPIQLGSRGSCQIGGNLATNAGGLRVIRYGHARQWVESLEVVLMSGEILELSGNLVKNNTGYDLGQLFIGSEGTLGIITAATLKLTPTLTDKHTLFLGCSSLPQAIEILHSARIKNLPLLAFEVLTHDCLKAVCQHRKLTQPFPSASAYYLVIDIECRDKNTSLLEEWIETLLKDSLINNGTLAQSPAEARALWEYREGITESLGSRGLVYKNDLCLPIHALTEFTSAILANAPQWYPKCEVHFFGHLGDGSLHINVIKPASQTSEEFLSLCETQNTPLFTLVRRLGGSIAAEHGIGLLKKQWLHFQRSPVELALFQAIKEAFDPEGLLNPGKIFNGSPRNADRDQNGRPEPRC